MHMYNKQLDRRWMRPRPLGGVRDRIAEYLALMTPGNVVSSNFMAMCDVAAENGVRSVKCRACKGLGFKEGDPFKVKQWEEQLREPDITTTRRDRLREKLHDESICEKCRGTGFRESRAKREAFDPVWTTVRCEQCKGCGEVENEDAEDVCPRCDGDMCVVPATVKRTGSSKKGRLPPGSTSMTDSDGNVTPGGVWSSVVIDALPEHDEAAMDEARGMSKVVGALAKTSPDVMAAVEAWEGPDGLKWAATKWGRRFALWPLTQAGMQLFTEAAEASKLGSGHLRRPIDVLTEERETESRAEVPNIRRRVLLAEAERQAMKLETRMRDTVDSAEVAL